MCFGAAYVTCAAGTVLAREDLVVLRPCPPGAIVPYDLERLLGRRTLKPLGEHDHLTWGAVAFAMAFPTALTFTYFVALAGQPRACRAVGKFKPPVKNITVISRTV